MFRSRPDRTTEPATEPATVPAPRPVPSVATIAALLRPIVRAGILHAHDGHSELFALGCVQRRARLVGLPGTNDGHRLTLADVLADALDALGEGPYGQAARLLCGATADGRGRTLAERRRLAAYALDVLPTWFRRHYEPQILRDLATEIYRTETLPRQEARS